MQDDATCAGLERRECFDAAAPIDVFEQQRCEKNIATRREIGALDIVLNDLGFEAMLGEPLTEAREKQRIQIGASEAVRTKDRGVEKIERLTGSRAGDDVWLPGFNRAESTRCRINSAAA